MKRIMALLMVLAILLFTISLTSCDGFDRHSKESEYDDSDDLEVDFS